MWSPWHSGLSEIHGILRNKAGRVSTASAWRAGDASWVQRSTLPMAFQWFSLLCLLSRCMATQRQAMCKMCMLLKAPVSSMFCHVGISYYS